MRKRTRAREIALKLLYQCDLRKGGLPDAEIDAVLAASSRDPQVREYARTILRGCLENLPEIDRRISKVSEHWALGRIAAIDRNILRLGTYEIIYMTAPEVPAKVSINEAIELAKRFSTEGSGAFVNGILDRIRVLREQEDNPDGLQEMVRQEGG